MVSFEALNRKRSGAYQKDEQAESFLEQMNRALEPFEQQQLEGDQLTQPLIQVVGLPRSGTTLLSQLLAYCLDVGYFTNIAARFWRAPVTGVRLSESIRGAGNAPGFRSNYGTTDVPLGIHEFGYFWRNTLHLDTPERIQSCSEQLDRVDWAGLRRTVAALQTAFGGKAIAGRNLYGAYGMDRFRRELGPVLWVYIERDPVDVAVSILHAREKFFDRRETWWSTFPPEFSDLLDQDFTTQIVGQVTRLRAFYSRQIAAMREPGAVIRVSYREMCDDPAGILERVCAASLEVCNAPIATAGTPPEPFAFRSYREQGHELAAHFAPHFAPESDTS